MMKRTMLAAFAAAAVGLMGAAPVDAQDYPDWRFDLGVNGGFSGYTAMLDDDHLGEDTDDIRFEPGWLLGAQATFWATPRVGIRANGSYSERPIASGGFFDAGDPEMVSDNNLWSLSGDVMFRPMARPWALGGREALPFIALGIGGKYFDQPGEEVLATGGDEEYLGRYFTAPHPTAGTQVFAVVEEWQLMGLASVGTDLRLADNLGLRLEFGDRFFDAPLRTETELLNDPEEDVGNVVHELFASVGAHFLMGLVRPEMVAVAPAPPQPPVEPEPEPVEERIRVCVIDPGADGGIRMVNAIYLPERGDTMVVVNGTRRALTTTLPNVMLANEAQWFVRGEPLTVTLDEDLTLEYTTWQSGRTIEANDLSYLGTVRGLPVYASADDVRDVMAELRDVRRVERTDDLDEILEARAELREDLEDVEFLYVPLRPTGCVFQALQQVPQVLKKDNN